MADELVAVAREIVNDRNLYHRIASRLLPHRGSRDIDEDLSGESGVVDRHIEFEALVLCLSRHAFTHEMHSVSHILDIVNRFYLEDVCLI